MINDVWMAAYRRVRLSPELLDVAVAHPDHDVPYTVASSYRLTPHQLAVALIMSRLRRCDGEFLPDELITAGLLTMQRRLGMSDDEVHEAQAREAHLAGKLRDGLQSGTALPVILELPCPLPVTTPVRVARVRRLIRWLIG